MSRQDPAAALVAALIALAVSPVVSASMAHAATDPDLRPATPAPAAATALTGPVTFHGRGWGHGVGMSQYGARGRALAGQTAADILEHYYTGTTLGTFDPNAIVRVLVLTGFVPSTSTPFRIYGRGADWAIQGYKGNLPANAVLELAKVPSGGTTTWKAVVRSSSGAVLWQRMGMTDFVVAPTDPATTLQLWSRPSTYDRYRGSLRVVASSSIAVVNHVRMNSYLRGVVPAEMPASWPTEAIRAQAIAARSYTAKRIRTTGIFDVFDDTRSQVYRGVLGEAAATTAAVIGTGGKIVRFGSAVADTYFHSTAGGWTEDNEKAWVGPTGGTVAGAVPYLRGVSDRRPNGTSYDDTSPYHTWKTATYSVAAVSAIFAKDGRTAVGTITSLDLSKRGVSGRLIAVKLIGSGGTKTVSGDVFRSVFNANKASGSATMWSSLVDLAPIP